MRACVAMFVWRGGRVCRWWVLDDDVVFVVGFEDGGGCVAEVALGCDAGAVRQSSFGGGGGGGESLRETVLERPIS